MTKETSKKEAVTVIGALIGFSLSFTTLSPLVIGCSFWALAVVMAIAEYILYAKGKKAPDCCGLATTATGLIITSSVVGVALGAAANSLFPGVMFNVWSATLIGAAIGVLGTVSASLVATCIIDPVIEKVTQCFSKEAHIWEEDI